MRPKLTKSVFIALQTGEYLVSNTMHSFGRPVFAEFVNPPARREGQWTRLVAAGAAGRCFLTFESPDHYELMVKRAVAGASVPVWLRPTDGSTPAAS